MRGALDSLNDRGNFAMFVTVEDLIPGDFPSIMHELIELWNTEYPITPGKQMAWIRRLKD